MRYRRPRLALGLFGRNYRRWNLGRSNRMRLFECKLWRDQEGLERNPVLFVPESNARDANVQPHRQQRTRDDGLSTQSRLAHRMLRGKCSSHFPELCSAHVDGRRTGWPCRTLYGASEAKAKLGPHKQPVVIVEKTNSPFEENIHFAIHSAEPISFAFALRIPGWCKAPQLLINKKKASLPRIQRGFAAVQPDSIRAIHLLFFCRWKRP